MIVQAELYFNERSGRVKKRLAYKPVPKTEIETISVKRGSGRGNAFQYTNTGYREDIGIIARSGWESNLARTLMLNGIKFDFEPKRFDFPIKRGTKAYIPDFYLPKTQEWIEVKGWLDKRSMTKLKRFKRYYPEEFSKLTMIIGRSAKEAEAFCEELEVPHVVFYQDIRDAFKDRIENWEGR